MTDLERLALRRVLDTTSRPYVVGASYDENFRQTGAGDDLKLLDDPVYKLAWERCHASFKMYLEQLFLAKATPKDLKKFVGNFGKTAEGKR